MPPVQLPSEQPEVSPPHSCSPAPTTHVAFFPNVLLILIRLTTSHTATDPAGETDGPGTAAQRRGTGGNTYPNVPVASEWREEERVRGRKRMELSLLLLLHRLVSETFKILLHAAAASAAAGPAQTSNFCSSSPLSSSSPYPPPAFSTSILLSFGPPQPKRQRQPVARRVLPKLDPAAAATTSADLLHFNCGC